MVALGICGGDLVKRSNDAVASATGTEFMGAVALTKLRFRSRNTAVPLPS
jgi:hypothetical protein